MRLDFKILWIDDQPRHVESFREGIQRQLSELGFELQVTAVSEPGAIDDAVGAHVHEDGVDLVLIDYDLGSGTRGEEVISDIRGRVPYKDLVFYSANDVDILRKIAFDAKLDNIYFSTRYTLVDDTVAIVRKILHKVMDVDHMRGVVMSATSDIDFIIEQSVVADYGRLSDKDQDLFREEVIAELGEKLQRWTTELDKAAKKETIQAIIKLRHICSASDRLKFILRALERRAPPGNTHLERAVVYRDTIVPQRNKLAHAKLTEEGGRRVLETPDGVISNDDMTQLRCQLVEHRTNFTDIAVMLDVDLT